VRGAFVLLKGRGPKEGMSRQAEGGLSNSRKMLRKVTPKTRLNHFLSNLTNSMKVVDFVIQLTVSVEELAQNTVTLGA
jgi:hypothetical protein